jgi:hypothetical protein
MADVSEKHVAPIIRVEESNTKQAERKAMLCLLLNNIRLLFGLSFGALPKRQLNFNRLHGVIFQKKNSLCTL